MLISEIESEGYKLRGGSVNPKSDRNVKMSLLLQRGQGKYLSWTYDGKNFTIPQSVTEDVRNRRKNIESSITNTERRAQKNNVSYYC